MTLSELLNKSIVNQIVRTTGTKYQPIDREALQSLIGLIVEDATNFNSGKQKKRRIRLQDIETSLITDMSGLFKNFDFTVFINQKANDLTIINKESLQDFIDDWDVSNVKDMSYMFAESVIFGQDLSKWDVSNVLDMSYIFNRSTFSGDISNWNIEKCMNFEMCINAGYADDQSQEILIKNKIYAHPLFINISGWLNNINTYLIYQPVCIDNNGDNIRGFDYISYREKNYIQANGSLDSLLHKHNSEITQVGIQSEIDCLYRNIINNNSEVSNYYLINKLIDATTKVGSAIDAYYSNIFLKNPEVGDHCVLHVYDVYDDAYYYLYNAKFIHKSVFNFLPKNIPYTLYILKPENLVKIMTFSALYDCCNLVKTLYNTDINVENYRAISTYIDYDVSLTELYLYMMKPIIDSLTTEEINYLQNNSWSTLVKMIIDDTTFSQKALCKIYLCLTAKERETYCERIQKLHEISSNKTFADSPEFKELFCELLKDDSKLYTALLEFTDIMTAATTVPEDLYYFVVHPADQPFIFTANLSNNQDYMGELSEYDLIELLTAINSHNDTRISEIVEDELLPARYFGIMKNINWEFVNCENWTRELFSKKVGMKYDTNTIYDAKLYDVDTKISYTCKVQLAFDDAITVKITEPDDNLTALDTEYYILNKNLYVSADGSDSNEYIMTSTRLIKFAPRNSTKTKYMLIYLPVMNDATGLY